MGDASTCDAACVSTAIEAGEYNSDDGCCPDGCTVETDNDCQVFAAMDSLARRKHVKVKRAQPRNRVMTVWLAPGHLHWKW